MIPGHEERSQRERGENEPLFVGLNRQDQKGSGEEKGHRDSDDTSEGETALQAIRDEAAEENTDKAAHQADHRERDGSLA